MNELHLLQAWFQSHCDGDWEHGHGVSRYRARAISTTLEFLSNVVEIARARYLDPSSRRSHGMGLLLLVVLAASGLLQSCGPKAPLDSPDARSEEVLWEAIDPVYVKAVYDWVSEDEAASLRGRLPVETIILESSGCYGSCPSFVAVLNREGRATYHAREYVDELSGTYDGVISLADFARLCLLLERLRFIDMDANYSAPWTDDNRMTMTVTYVGEAEPVVVSDYGRQGPPEFYALTLAVEEAVRNIAWKPGDRAERTAADECDSAER